MQWTSNFCFCYLRIMGEFIRTFHSKRKGPEAELMKAITQAIQQGRSALSEFESKQVLAPVSCLASAAYLQKF